MPLEQALRLAQFWGSEFVNAGRQGHINVASGHGPWPAGERLLAAVCEAGPSPIRNRV